MCHKSYSCSAFPSLYVGSVPSTSVQLESSALCFFFSFSAIFSFVMYVNFKAFCVCVVFLFVSFFLCFFFGFWVCLFVFCYCFFQLVFLPHRASGRFCCVVHGSHQAEPYLCPAVCQESQVSKEYAAGYQWTDLILKSIVNMHPVCFVLYTMLRNSTQWGSNRQED